MNPYVKRTSVSLLPGGDFAGRHLSGLQNAWKTLHSGAKTIVFLYKIVTLGKTYVSVEKPGHAACEPLKINET